jgi:hypothetical protein
MMYRRTFLLLVTAITLPCFASEKSRLDCFEIIKAHVSVEGPADLASLLDKLRSSNWVSPARVDEMIQIAASEGVQITHSEHPNLRAIIENEGPIPGHRLSRFVAGVKRWGGRSLLFGRTPPLKVIHLQNEVWPELELFVEGARLTLRRWLDRFTKPSGRSLFYEAQSEESRTYLLEVLAYLYLREDTSLATAMLIPVTNFGPGPSEFRCMAQWASVHYGVPMMKLTYFQLKETAENFTLSQAADVEDPNSPRADQYNQAEAVFSYTYETYHL